MTYNLNEIDEMDDEALEAALAGGNGGDTEAETDEQAQEQEQPATEQADQTQGDTAAPEAQQQEQTQQEHAPKLIPLPELQAERRKRQEAEAELARYRQSQQQAATQAQQQQQAATIQEEIDRLYLDEGPEAAAAYAQEVADRQSHAVAQQYAEREVSQRIAMSETYAKRTYGEAEYNRQLQKVVEKLGPETALSLAAQQDDPGDWVYQFGKSLETPEERAASIQAEVQKQVQAVLGKQGAPTQRGNDSIARLSSNTAAPAPLKDPDDMSDEELDEAIAIRRRK